MVPSVLEFVKNAKKTCYGKCTSGTALLIFTKLHLNKYVPKNSTIVPYD